VPEIAAAYLDSCTYFEDSSVAKARAFVSACTAMLARGIRRIEYEGAMLELDPNTLRALANDAKAYAAQHAAVESGGSGVIYPNFRDLRS